MDIDCRTLRLQPHFDQPPGTGGARRRNQLIERFDGSAASRTCARGRISVSTVPCRTTKKELRWRCLSQGALDRFEYLPAPERGPGQRREEKGKHNQCDVNAHDRMQI